MKWKCTSFQNRCKSFRPPACLSVSTSQVSYVTGMCLTGGVAI